MRTAVEVEKMAGSVGQLDVDVCQVLPPQVEADRVLGLIVDNSPLLNGDGYLRDDVALLSCVSDVGSECIRPDVDCGHRIQIGDIREEDPL